MNDKKPSPVLTSSVKVSDERPTDPNANLQQFLAENNYVLSVDALSDKNPYLEGKGFVLTEKPLLVISVRRVA